MSTGRQHGHEVAETSNAPTLLNVGSDGNIQGKGTSIKVRV